MTNEPRDKFVFIHVAMRPVDRATVDWYVTSASNYIPPWLPLPLRQHVLERVTRRIAQREDKVQLEKMASDSAKEAHASRMFLELDTIYGEWEDFVRLRDEGDSRSPSGRSRL